MRTHKELDVEQVDEAIDSAEPNEEEKLEWLLDMDVDEPEESLFKIEDDYVDAGLSAFEAEVAGRPMFRGNEGGDDLANYVEEEIVISSDSARSDIYSDEVAEEKVVEEESHIMAIDYSRREESARDADAVVEEGLDILGLASEDDMGESFLTIKRVKGASAAADTVARPVARVVNGASQPGDAGAADTPAPADLEDAPVTSQVADPQDQQVANEAPPAAPAFGETLDMSPELPAADLSAQAGVAAAGPLEGIAQDADATELDTTAVAQDADEGFGQELQALQDLPGLQGLDDLEGLENQEGLQDLEGLDDQVGLDDLEEQAQAVAARGDDDYASVLDYVASTPRPEDDDEFDDFLLQGGHLDSQDADPDELELVAAEGDFSLDASAEVEIDYHEDFAMMDGLSRDSAAEIAATIPSIMRELGEAATARLAGVGLDAAELGVDARLGVDEASIKQCYTDGYEPVCSVFPGVPGALQHLAANEREAVYVRLYNSASGQSWNDLFSPDFHAPADMLDESSTVASAEAMFNDDSPEYEFSVLGDLDGFDDEVVLHESDPGDLLDELDSFGESLLSTAANDDIAELDDAAPPAARDDDAVPPAFAGDTAADMAEDIFGGDLSVEFDDADMALEAGLTQDIDAAFASLSADAVAGAGEICGVDMDEFGAGADEPAAADEPVAATAEQPFEPGREDTPAPAVEQAQEQPQELVLEQAQEPVAQADTCADLSWCVPAHIKFSYTTRTGGEIFTDFLDAFLEEGSAEVEKLEDLISEWEKDSGAEQVVAEISRTLHTVKGIAKGVGLQRFGTLIHNFETLLDAMPQPESDDEQTYFRMVNVWLDAVVRGIDFVGAQRADIASELPQVGKAGAADPVAQVAEAAEPALQEAPVEDVAAEQPASPAGEREKRKDQQLADEGAKALAAQQSVRITSEKLDHLLNLASQSQQLCVRASQSTSRSKRSTSELQGRLSSVRTHIGKIADRALLTVNARGASKTPDLDALEMDQYSELQEAASILREGVEDLADLIELLGRQNSQVEALLKQQSSVISSISSSIQAARVVPVSRLMPGLRRIVRTVSTDLGKVVTFRVLNEVGALDRDYYARLQVALEHMVRNALDHGIEAPEDRLAAGKPNAGRITIDVDKSGGDYVIRLSDDGKGIDPDALRESAYEKGLDVDVDALSDEEAIRLIFHKGFSTASTLSEISGRGVGMDIVLTEIQQIGGDIQIESVVGEGTTFIVRIPSNVTVNGALLVTAGDHSYAVPLNGLIAVDQVPADDFFAAVASGEPLRLFDMDCEPGYLATLCQGVALPERSFWESFVPVIIAGSEERHMAIALDSVQEALELVVRSLGSQFSAVPGVAGAATTSDGEAIVALDLNMLVDSVRDDGVAAVAVDRDDDAPLLALVVDDSRTQRMVATSQLDTVGVETVTAENGLVAIDLLNATHRLPDVVLLDVEMPVKDGIQTLREIRKSRRYGHLPVIMVTSRTGAKHRALAKEAGCNAYMGKPFNFPALVEQINVLTGHDLQLS